MALRRERRRSSSSGRRGFKTEYGRCLSTQKPSLPGRWSLLIPKRRPLWCSTGVTGSFSGPMLISVGPPRVCTPAQERAKKAMYWAAGVRPDCPLASLRQPGVRSRPFPVTRCPPVQTFIGTSKIVAEKYQNRASWALVGDLG